MQKTGLFLMIFGLLLVLQETGSRMVRYAKWNKLISSRGGKRQSADPVSRHFIAKAGGFCLLILPKDSQEKARRLLIWSGFDKDGRSEQFLGVTAVLCMLSCTLLITSGLFAIRFTSWSVFTVGSLLAFMVAVSPVLAIYSSRVKRVDQIMRDFPLLVSCLRRELVRSANYIDAFSLAERELKGTLREEIAELNEYIRSTRGDIRGAIENLKSRCGHRTIDLFCMTVIQGMDMDRIIDGLTELEQQMSGILKDRVQKQTEKRNLLVFFGTLGAASILLMQGAFYGLMKFREQMSSLPFL